LEGSRVPRLTGFAIDKPQLCHQPEKHQRNAISLHLSPKETIIGYNRRLNQPPQGGPVIGNIGASFCMGPSQSLVGRDLVRPALHLSIRSALMNGCLAGIVDPGNDG